jgi:hypothetical protein
MNSNAESSPALGSTICGERWSAIGLFIRLIVSSSRSALISSPRARRALSSLPSRCA